ncbi:unnamed protein product [Prunus armeniaca]
MSLRRYVDESGPFSLCLEGDMSMKVARLAYASRETCQLLLWRWTTWITSKVTCLKGGEGGSVATEGGGHYIISKLPSHPRCREYNSFCP